MVGSITVFITEGGRVATEYFYRGGYQEATAWKAVKGVFSQGLVVVGAGLTIVMIAREFAEGRPINVETAASKPLIFMILVFKFSTDLTRYYLSTLDQPLREMV